MSQSRDSSGFLRITAREKKELERLVSSVIRRTCTEDDARKDITTFNARLAVYPTDRSCYTCDYFFAGHCREWDAEPPSQFLDRGCDKHQDDGAPF